MLHSLKRLVFHLFKTAATVFVAVITSFFSVAIGFVLLIAIGIGLGMAAGQKEEQSPLDDFEYHAGNEDSNAFVASLGINGIILGSRDELNPLFSLLSDTSVVYGYEVKDALAKLAKEESVKGVILEINSPGGTIYGARAIVDGVTAYKKATGKPVFAYVSSMAASGGYWVAASGTKLLADHGTEVGSIGVITGPFKEYKDVVAESGEFGASVQTEGGINTTYITAGTHKDLGNPYRPLTEEERAVLQDGVNGAYDEFVGYVSQQRRIDPDTIRNSIGALIYSDKQALDRKLIDEVVDRDAAYAQVARSAGITDDDFQVIQKQNDDSFFGALSSSLHRGALASLAGALHAGGSVPSRYSFCGTRALPLVYAGNSASLCQ